MFYLCWRKVWAALTLVIWSQSGKRSLLLRVCPSSLREQVAEHTWWSSIKETWLKGLIERSLILRLHVTVLVIIHQKWNVSYFYMYIIFATVAVKRFGHISSFNSMRKWKAGDLPGQQPVARYFSLINNTINWSFFHSLLLSVAFPIRMTPDIPIKSFFNNMYHNVADIRRIN